MNEPADKQKNDKVGFLCCIESGFLEEQVLLLAKSLRMFGGLLSQSNLYAVCPVASRQPSMSTIHALQSLNVEVIIEDLNKRLLNFPYANKSYALEHISKLANHEILVFLDSDTLFLDEPSRLILASNIDFAARPVDIRGICASPFDCVFLQYWQQLCELAEITIDDLPIIETSMDQTKIFANYNGGLLVFRRSLEVGRLWRKLLETSWDRGITPKPDNFWGSGQSTLAVAVHALRMRHKILDLSYNIPMHLIETASEPWTEVNPIHLHYHWLLEKDNFPVWKNKIKYLRLGRSAYHFLSRIRPFKKRRGASSSGF